MSNCACTDMLMMVECDQFITHVRERISTAVIAEIEVARAEDEAYTQRVLYGVPGASRPLGVIRG